MRTVLLILFITLSAITSATDYYISASGNDATNNGTSPSTPWKTISKINSILLKPGDKILFHCGDTFYGTLKITKSGISGNPITVGAYGTGNNPIITGFTLLTSWTDEGNGIYSASLCSINRLEIVLMDNKQYWMGQYPDNGFLSYESFNDNLSITDYNLPSTPDWTGAEIFLRKNLYSTTRATIINHSNQTLTYTDIANGDNEALSNNFGYIIQNDIRTLKDFGDWFYNSKTAKFYMYFGLTNPNDHVVKAANLDDLISISEKNFITIENISLFGCNQRGINATSVNNITINNCKIDYIGSQGIYLVWDLTSSNIAINNSQFGKINGNAVELFANNISFTNNIIDSVGLIHGACYGTNDGNGLYGKFDNGLIQFNEISNTGHNGIYPTGSNFTIINNYIHNTVLKYLDAGAIYITHDGAKYPGQILRNNIIINAVGNNWGTGNYNSIWGAAEGIYLDSYNDNVTVDGNTITQCNQGLKLFESQGTLVKNNTIFNNEIQIAISNSNSCTPLHPVRGLNINDNIAIAKEGNQLTLFFYSVENDINLFGTSDHNFWARPINDSYTFYTNIPSTGEKYKNLPEWQLLTGQDANSHSSPVAIKDTTDIDFYYNPTRLDKIITLGQPMIDVRGTKYRGTVTLLPFTSIILMVDPDPTSPVMPVYISTSIKDSSPSTLEITCDQILANNIPPNSAFNVFFNFVARTINSVSIFGTKVIPNLSASVKNNDIVTVSYIQPSANPLQTPSGDKAVSIYNQQVTNNVNVVNTPPNY